jgi:hypothetical protein
MYPTRTSARREREREQGREGGRERRRRGGEEWKRERQRKRERERFLFQEIQQRAGCQWLTPIILSTWETGRDQEDHRLKPAPGQQFERPYLKDTQYKKGLVEWLKWQSACLAIVKP